jgi:hypothetical protein
MLGNVTGVHTASKQVIVDADDKVGIRIIYPALKEPLQRNWCIAPIKYARIPMQPGAISTYY